MKDKDRAIQAIDAIAEALQILCRANYDNPKQSANSHSAATGRLYRAITILGGDKPLTPEQIKNSNTFEAQMAAKKLMEPK